MYAVRIVNNIIRVNIPDYIARPTRVTRSYHNSKFINIGSTSNTYKYNFFTRTLKRMEHFRDSSKSIGRGGSGTEHLEMWLTKTRGLPPPFGTQMTDPPPRVLKHGFLISS